MRKLISYIKLQLFKRRLKKKYNIILKDFTTTKTKKTLYNTTETGPLCYEVGIDKKEAIKRMKERREMAGLVGEALKNYDPK